MTAYFKLSGGGNDFLALVEPTESPEADQIRAWCRRGLSLGADGLFILRRTAAGARMDHFNADGGAAELCLNGTRCAVELVLELGWAVGTAEIATADGPVVGRRGTPGEVALELPPPPAPEARSVAVAGTDYAGWWVRVGVPHFVLAWPETLAAAPVADLGPAIRRHAAFEPQGTNVDFVRFAGRRRIEIRTFERGVEAETLACGTGVLASVAVGLAREELELPAEALTSGGFALHVDRARPSTGEPHWTLAGDARILSRGTLTPAAERVPEPPRWS